MRILLTRLNDQIYHPKGAYVNPTIGSSSLRIKTLESKKENGNFTEQDQEELDSINREQEHRLECFNKLINLGVPMSAGSDSAWGKYKMGNYFEEIEAHVKGGQSPVEAIMSATDIAAQSCWIDDNLGSIETGKLADILIVKEDIFTKGHSFLDPMTGKFFEYSNIADSVLKKISTFKIFY